MSAITPDFSLDVGGVKGFCPAGEVHSERSMAERKVPVLSCEGPCIRGEIARLAANRIASEVPGLARACHAETFFVPHSAMSRWVRQADKSIMIDGCFLQCHGRVLRKLVGDDKVLQFNAYPFYRKYTDVFLMDDVPQAEREEAARQVADALVTRLKDTVGRQAERGRP